MNNNEQEVYRDELDTRYNNFLEEQQDINYSLKKVDQELFSCYADLSGRRRHKYVDGKRVLYTDELVMWVRFCRDKLNDAVKTLEFLKATLDDIEDEINRDEVNNAK